MVNQSGYWSMETVEYRDPSTQSELRRVGKYPAGKKITQNLNLKLPLNALPAPIRFSNVHGLLVFKNDEMSLIMKHVQVQPKVEKARFERVWNSNNFMSIPILSGLFVTAILLVALSIAITAILSIKSH